MRQAPQINDPAMRIISVSHGNNARRRYSESQTGPMEAVESVTHCGIVISVTVGLDEMI
jgi:hypothetical protein